MIARIGMDELTREWDWSWNQIDEVLADVRESEKEDWSLWGLAVALDVPSLRLPDLIPPASAAGLAKDFDPVERIRRIVDGAMERLREHGVEGAEGPLPIEWALTGTLLAWEWSEMEAAGEDWSLFFERLRELRMRLPEVALCERTVHAFCERVPPPRIPG